ncbi:Protein of unknown function, partial [Gryllus bimaculatus]
VAAASRLGEARYCIRWPQPRALWQGDGPACVYKGGRADEPAHSVPASTGVHTPAALQLTPADMKVLIVLCAVASMAFARPGLIGLAGLHGITALGVPGSISIATAPAAAPAAPPQPVQETP